MWNYWNPTDTREVWVVTPDCWGLCSLVVIASVSSSVGYRKKLSKALCVATVPKSGPEWQTFRTVLSLNITHLQHLHFITCTNEPWWHEQSPDPQVTCEQISQCPFSSTWVNFTSVPYWFLLKTFNYPLPTTSEFPRVEMSVDSLFRSLTQIIFSKLLFSPSVSSSPDASYFEIERIKIGLRFKLACSLFCGRVGRHGSPFSLHCSGVSLQESFLWKELLWFLLPVKENRKRIASFPLQVLFPWWWVKKLR